MTGIHIDDFFADATHTLTSLFSVFPRPVTIFAEDICGPDEPDEFGVHSNRYQSCFATLLWLGEEGYIRFEDTIKHDAVDQAVLTGRCFAALLRPVLSSTQAQANFDEDLPPSVQAEHASLIHHMEQALKSRSSTAIRDAFIPLIERMS